MRAYLNDTTMSVLILALFIALWTDPMYVLMRLPDKYNAEYGRADFDQLKSIASDIRHSELRQPIKLAARKGYLAYFSGSEGVALPYSDYQGLVRYLSLNDVNLVFLEHRQLDGYPFVRNFVTKKVEPEFTLLYSGFDSFGQKLEVYKFAGQQATTR